MVDAQRRAPSGPGLPLVVAFPAEVDLCNAGRLGEELRSMIRPGGPAVVADLTGTGFMSCAGVRMLIAVHRQATENGTGLRVAAPCALVARLFQVTEADRALRIYPTAAAALTAGEQP
jgi:anti-anti-sigma factor